MYLQGVVQGAVFVSWILAAISGIQCQQQSTSTIGVATVKYPHVKQLDAAGKYILRWGYNKTHIWFEAQVNTLGYVAFGISETGLMWPADVVVGYVSGGRVTFADYHNKQYGHPTLDSSQDWALDDGHEHNGWTFLSFTRPLDTCDRTGDRIITRDETQYLIYAYHSQDPPNQNALAFHEQRGSKVLNLLTASSPPSSVVPGVEIAEFRTNFTVPMQDTSHHCRLFTLAGTSISRAKHHIVKIAPIFPPASEANIRKLTLFRCRFPDMTILQGKEDQYNCFWDGAAHQQHCKEYVVGFIPGGEDFYLPDDVGIPLGGSAGADLFVLATEYNNENFDTVVDTSGVRIWYTASLRPHDAAFLTIANPISEGWHQFIPPGEASFVQRAYCPRNCLEWGFNATRENRITILGAQFQGRGLATAMRLRHLVPGSGQQGNTAERPWVFDNRKYTHRAQSVQMADMRHTVSATDILMLECTYDTRGSTANYTVGGWAENEELCRAHVLYYPAIPLEGCLSWNQYDSLVDSTGAPIPSNQVFSVLKTVDWRDASMRNFLKQTLDTSMERSQCWSSRQTPTVHSGRFSYPTTPNPYRKPQTSTCRRGRA